MRKRNIYKGLALGVACLLLFSGCQASEKGNGDRSASKLSMGIKAAKNRTLNSVGMPDDWANWGGDMGIC